MKDTQHTGFHAPGDADFTFGPKVKIMTGKPRRQVNPFQVIGVILLAVVAGTLTFKALH